MVGAAVVAVERVEVLVEMVEHYLLVRAYVQAA